MNVSMDIEEREITVTKVYISLNDYEFEAPRFLDFIETIEGTDGFMSGVTNVSGTDRKIAEALEEMGIVAHTHSAGWFVKDEDVLEELWERSMVLYHDDLDEETVKDIEL